MLRRSYMAASGPTSNPLSGQRVITRSAGPVGASYAVAEKNWVLDLSNLIMYSAVDNVKLKIMPKEIFV